MLLQQMVTSFRFSLQTGIATKFSDQELTKTKVPTLLMIGQEEVIYGSIDATIKHAKEANSKSSS